MKKITFLTLFLFFCWHEYAQIDPIDVTGFNEDVIANGVGPMSESTTIPIDADSFCYLSEDWKLNAEDPDITVGLPSDGLITSPITTGLTYQIPTAATPYEGNNSLRIDESGTENGGTFTLTTPTGYANVYVLVTSGSGASTMNITVNFSDDTTQEFTGVSIPDWYQTGLPVEASGIGRGDTSNNNVETPFNNPKLFQLKLEISVGNQTKEIESITFEKTNSGDSVFNALAISGEEAPSCLAPFDVEVSEVTMTDAQLAWDSVSTTVDWEIEYGEAGFNLGEGTVIQVTDGNMTQTLGALDAATQYEVYIKTVCDDGESQYVGPIEFDTPICDPSEQCNYSFVMTDSYGDGWNGNNMSVLQNGIEVANIQLTGGSSETVEVPICDGVNMELYWNSGGSYGYEVGVEILDPYGTSIYEHPSGVSASGSSLFSTVASCPEPPTNDNLANAIALELDAECTGDIYYNVMASAEEGEPSGSCFEPIDEVDHSVWFSFVAPIAGAVDISTDIAPSDFDSQLTVYEAPSDVNDLTTLTTEVACNQDISEGNTTSHLELTGLTAGETYYIQVDGKEENQGNFCIVVNEIPCPDPSNIEITDIMGNSAQVNWTSNGIETAWQIEYGEPGFEPGTGTIVADEDGTPGYLLTELSIDTNYEVYVSAICGEEASNPIGPVAFTTPPCPEDIEVLAEEGICGATVTYDAPESAEGGPSGNLIVNPNGEDGLNGWNIETNGGSGWAAQNGGFVTSYGTCRKSQEIILADVGFTNEQMDSQPEITIAEDYVGTSSNPADTYFLNVELRDADGNVIDSFESGNITTTAETQTITHTFSGYGPGVRSIYFADGGDDAEGWAGQYGSKMNNAQVLINLPDITVEQTEGIASGEEFPVGTTTNTFEITQGDEEPVICTFNVVVLDVENPVAMANDISLEMNEEGLVELTPEDLDAGSTDNCEIESMSLDIVSLDCDNIGENEITLTIIDASGNTSTATAIVTLTDPNEYCNFSLAANQNFPVTIYPNPAENTLFINADQAFINQVQLFSMQGKLVKEILINDQQKVQGDISELSTGVYFVKVYSKTGKTSVKQIIKK